MTSNDALTSYYNDNPPTITPRPATEHQHDPAPPTINSAVVLWHSRGATS